MSPGHSDELMHAFLARDLRSDPLSPDEDEDIRTERVPLSQVNELIESGGIQDAKTIAALLMAKGALARGGF
jgi:ADP-ribose pyrophosphatase